MGPELRTAVGHLNVCYGHLKMGHLGVRNWGLLVRRERCMSLLCPVYTGGTE